MPVLCPVCLDDIQLHSGNASTDNDTTTALSVQDWPALLTPCGHVFHAACIKKSLAAMDVLTKQPVCPVCRSSCTMGSIVRMHANCYADDGKNRLSRLFASKSSIGCEGRDKVRENIVEQIQKKADKAIMDIQQQLQANCEAANALQDWYERALPDAVAEARAAESKANRTAEQLQAYVQLLEKQKLVITEFEKQQQQNGDKNE